MAEPVNGGNSNPGQSPKELSMEVRLLLAFLLMGAVMFVTPYLPFFKTTAPQGGKPPETTATAPGGPPVQPGQRRRPPAGVTAEAAQAAPAGPLSASATPQQPMPNLTVETDLYRISFSNQGATVRSWLLKATDAKGRIKYRGNDGKPLDLINPAASPPCAAPPHHPLSDRRAWNSRSPSISPANSPAPR